MVERGNTNGTLNAHASLANGAVADGFIEASRDTRAHLRRQHAPRQSRSKSRNSAHREFDRKSGTGRGREMKKHGEGSHNWGSDLALAGLKSDGKTPNNFEDDSVSPPQEIMDFSCYQELMQSRKMAPVVDPNLAHVSTQEELERDGYVRYVKEYYPSNNANGNINGDPRVAETPASGTGIGVTEYKHDLKKKHSITRQLQQVSLNPKQNEKRQQQKQNAATPITHYATSSSSSAGNTSKSQATIRQNGTSYNSGKKTQVQAPAPDLQDLKTFPALG